MNDVPFIWVQVKDENGNYKLIDGESGEIIFSDVCGWFCDAVFRLMDYENRVYVRQFG